MNSSLFSTPAAARPLGDCSMWVVAAAALIGAVLTQPCRADSALQAGVDSGGAIAGSAHLDFRITVLPSLALSTQGNSVRIQGNSGVMTLQRSQAGASDGLAPAGSIQLSPRRHVVDTSVAVSSVGGNNIVTVASP